MTNSQISAIASARAMLASGDGRARRVAARISLSEVAAVLGVRPETVWRWESGRRQPAAEDALAYAKLVEDATAAIGHAACGGVS
jgi:transcriptional regulator with XRE-family HTH domain